MGPRWRRTTLLFSLAISALGATPAAAFVASVSVTRAATAGPIDTGFLGLALEYDTIPKWTAHGAEPVNPVLVQLIRNLNPAGRPVVRIGGISTDRAWWPAPGQSKPIGVTFTLSKRWARAVRAFAQALDARLLLGVNLEANRPALDRVEANDFLADIGRRYIAAMELGNEPDLYTWLPWYRTIGGQIVPWYYKDGLPVYARAPGYDPAEFDSDFSRALQAMPDVPIAGPELSNPSWFSAFSQFLSPTSRVRMLTSHAYGLSNCDTSPSSPQYPSVPDLLSVNASRNLMNGLEPYVNLVHGDGGSYRVDEIGSVSCNGHPGVSNSFASSLWLLDSLFALAADHVNGVNLHTYPNSVNGLFDFTRAGDQWTAAVHPIYYGALMFADAAPPGSKLVSVSSNGGASLRTWATSGPGDVVRVLLINDSLSSSALAVVNAPAGFAPKAAPVLRLQAPSASATGHVSIGGRTFGAGTTTGVLQQPVPDAVRPSGGGYRVTLPAASAALLTLSPG